MPRRMGRPGLMGTMARTAVIAGTASATSNMVANKMSAGQQGAAAQPAAPAQQVAEPAPQPVAAEPPAPAGGISDDTIAQLEKLSNLHQAGALTDEEFAAAKVRLLGL